MSLSTDKEIWNMLKGNIQTLIFNKYNGLKCFLYCHDFVMQTCYNILLRMLDHHNVYPERSMAILHKNMDQEENTKDEKIIYCFFYIAYCFYFIEFPQKQERNAKKEEGPTPNKAPEIIIFPNDSAESSEPSAPPEIIDPKSTKYSSRPSINPEIIDSLENKIKELNDTIAKLQEDQKHIKPWKDIVELIRKSDQ